MLLLLIGLGLLWLTFRNENLNEIFQKLTKADPFWLTVSLVLALGAFLSRAVRWAMLMEPLGYKPRLSNTLYALLVGYFANLAIPRIGEITRCGVLTKTEKVPFNALIGTVIVERVIDLLMLFVSMVLVAFLEYNMLRSFINEKILILMGSRFIFLSNPFFWLALFVVAIVILFLFIRFKKGTQNENKLVTKIRGLLFGVGSGLRSVFRMKNNGWFLFHTILIWVIYFLMTWVCFFCLDSTSHLDMKAGLFTMVAGGIGMSMPVQGGIGAYHTIVAAGLEIFGVAPTDGKVYAVLVHTSQTLLVVVLGLFALLMLFIDRKKSANG